MLEVPISSSGARSGPPFIMSGSFESGEGQQNLDDLDNFSLEATTHIVVARRGRRDILYGLHAVDSPCTIECRT